ncbi:hypothetical protein ADK64_41230 [Streptomyces sp. MMG1121]|nr:hypothetical protein ADK64_41230 [Streptomyces sp. MMG1121]
MLAAPAQAAERQPNDPGPSGIVSSAGKLPGQISNILGSNGSTGITNNLNQMLNKVNLIDSTLQNVVSTITGVVLLPS